MNDQLNFLCEYNDCANLATVEWYDHSEFEDKYESNPSANYTFRCDAHPVKDTTTYQVRDI